MRATHRVRINRIPRPVSRPIPITAGGGERDRRPVGAGARRTAGLCDGRAADPEEEDCRRVCRERAILLQERIRPHPARTPHTPANFKRLIISSGTVAMLRGFNSATLTASSIKGYIM